MAKKNLPYDEKYYDREVETMPRPELEKLQLERLKDELVWSYENSPYYKRAWDEAGVDPVTGEVLPYGEKGEIVYTTLTKRSRPMIRFRSGDIGWVNREACECGRTHARIYITGRKDEMFIVSAVNVFPSDIEHVVRKDKGLTGEYRIRAYDEDDSR